MVSRRNLLTLGAAFLSLPSLGRASDHAVVDVLGREVTLSAQPQRIVLLDGSDLFTVAALLPDPADRVVGWASAARLDLGAKAGLLGADFPEVGRISPETVSVEAILALNPDLVVSSAYMLPPEGSVLAEHFAQAGIPVAWSSGHDRAFGPQEKLRRAMGFWGAVLGQEARAAELAAWGAAHFARLATRSLPQQLPRVYMEVMTTYDSCCWAAGQSFWSDLFALAGGDLMTEAAGWSQQLSAEGLLALNPEVYIATGGNFAPARQPGIAPGLDTEAARAGLKQAAARQGLVHTDAVRTGRVHGIWSGLISSPLLLVVLTECLARWLHPGQAADIDPAATLAELNTYFPAPLPGPMWVTI